ncbi:MAG: type I restriction enzyme HsdR N-terminal domain-containing protein [Bacteroidota bacterium]
MTNPLQLDLLKFQDELVIKKVNGVVKVFDPVRNKFLVKGPEEIVRQLTIQYLIKEKKYKKNRMAVEKMLMVNGLLKRFDILVYDERTAPFILVECKAPAVSISEVTFRQIAAYNLPLKVKYLLVTNGIDSYCCEMNYEKQTFEFLDEVPCFVEMN